MRTQFNNFMELALQEARLSGDAGEVPVGAVIVRNGEPIAFGQNRTRRDLDPSAHAEIIAIRKASKILSNARLVDCDLFVSLEPCAMCAACICEARIRRLYFAADDPKSGGTFHGAKIFEHTQCHHKPEIYSGLREKEARELLQNFFQNRRKG